ncbi:hypothetical protein GCM10010430_56560 [Kitasatospora cystarginea]|uniref:Uncharacterized protein n=1 Tax=Kitasatospora cystarginea TaxID=58350 RepID=A0ABN3EN78_9ACTN
MQYQDKADGVTYEYDLHSSGALRILRVFEDTPHVVEAYFSCRVAPGRGAPADEVVPSTDPQPHRYTRRAPHGGCTGCVSGWRSGLRAGT